MIGCYDETNEKKGDEGGNKNRERERDKERREGWVEVRKGLWVSAERHEGAWKRDTKIEPSSSPFTPIITL